MRFGRRRRAAVGHPLSAQYAGYKRWRGHEAERLRREREQSKETAGAGETAAHFAGGRVGESCAAVLLLLFAWRLADRGWTSGEAGSPGGSGRGRRSRISVEFLSKSGPRSTRTRPLSTTTPQYEQLKSRTLATLLVLTTTTICTVITTSFHQSCPCSGINFWQF